MWARPTGWLGLLIVSAWGACATAKLPVVNATDLARARFETPDITLEALERGRTLYRSRCAQCHDAFHPASRDRLGWDRALEEMAPRARLKSAERALVRDYLHLFASE